jgi:phosphate transport system substrate-binding protein
MERIAPVTFVPRRVVVAGVVLGSFAAAAPASAAVTQIAGSGSSASTPYLEVLFKAYKKVDPSVKFVFTANNGNAGAADVQAGRSQFAVQTRPPLPSDSGLTYSKLFLDALTISVNPANKLSNLPLSNAKDIFTGKVTEWSAYPDSGLTAPISAFGRNATAGLFTFFTAAVLGGEAQGTNVTPLDKDGEVAVALSKNPNGIGYVGLANSREGSGVKRLSLNGVAATPKTIKSLKYPLSRYAWIVLPAKSPNKKVLKFADWIRSSYEAGVVIEKAGAVPAFNATKPAKKKTKKK